MGASESGKTGVEDHTRGVASETEALIKNCIGGWQMPRVRDCRRINSPLLHILPPLYANLVNSRFLSSTVEPRESPLLELVVKQRGRIEDQCYWGWDIKQDWFCFVENLVGLKWEGLWKQSHSSLGYICHHDESISSSSQV